jgi:nicotinamidase-related amidase
LSLKTYLFTIKNQLKYSNPSTTKMSTIALLVMDVQVCIVSRLPLPQTYLPLLKKTITTARSHMKIIYVTVSFRPGHPEVAATSAAAFTGGKANNMFVAGSPETAIEPSIAPTEGDIVVEKKRVSAFTGSGLDVILRGLGIKTLVLAGVSTGGVVLSTVCEASDLDLCVDPDEKLHEMLVEKIFKKRGEVLGAEEWLTTLGA